MAKLNKIIIGTPYPNNPNTTNKLDPISLTSSKTKAIKETIRQRSEMFRLKRIQKRLEQDQKEKLPGDFELVKSLFPPIVPVSKVNRKVKIKRHKNFDAKLLSLIERNKITPKKVYPKEKCAFIKDGKRCSRNAVGKGQLCEKHGGEKRIHDNCLISQDLDKAALAVVKKVQGSLKLNPYDPEVHPKEFLKLSKEGLSAIEIAAEFKVPIHRMQKWAEDYLDFSEAWDIGKAIYESWWLEKGKEGLHDPRNFNTPLFKYLTQNKLGYSEKTESRNFNMNAGVLIVPGTTKTIDEWEKEGSITPLDSMNALKDKDF
jgi:hypothetical protein